jgi:methyl-accepting chemotaxis protein
MNNETLWLIVFVALTAFALLVQAIVMAVAYFTVRKTINSVQGDLSEIRSTVMPMLTRSKDLLEKVAPKVADIAQAAREQSAHIRATADEILTRVNRQTSRVDHMFTGVIDSVEHAGNVVSDSVARPVRQVSAILASAKAFLTVLATGRRPERPADVVTDQDMFV